MTLFKNKYRIESTRLYHWDYSWEGAYFVTICVKNRKEIFGEIRNGIMGLNRSGCIAARCWLDLPNHYSNCFLDEFIIMPNHVHGVIVIVNGFVDKRHMGTLVARRPFLSCVPPSVETGLKPVSTGVGAKGASFMPVTNVPISKNNKCHSLSEMIRAFKTFSARQINQLQNSQGQPLWQPRFYDHVIRNEKTFNRIRQYIQNNPFKWERDRNNPENVWM